MAYVCKLSFDGSQTAASPEAHCPASPTKSVSSSFGEKPVSKNTGEGHLRKTFPFPKHVQVHGHSNTYKKQDPLFLHYLFVCGGYEGGLPPHPHAYTANIWRSEDKFQSSLCSFQHVGSGNGTQAIRVGRKYLYPLSHLNSPHSIYLNSLCKLVFGMIF